MSRRRLPSVMWIYSGLANLALSIVLVHFCGLTGLALGTLDPNQHSLFGVRPALRNADPGCQFCQLLKEICSPTLLPVVAMAVVLSALWRTVEPSSLLSIIAVAGIGLLEYVIGYLNWAASEFEWQTCRSFGLSTILYAEACFKRT